MGIAQLKYFKQALESKPNWVPCLYALSLTWYKMEKIAEWMKAVEQAMVGMEEINSVIGAKLMYLSK